MVKYKILPEEVGNRLDVTVAAIYPKLSRSSIEPLFDLHKVTVNDKPGKPSYNVRAGDEIKVDDELIMRALPPIELPIIYEDDNVIVINKPDGILTHSKGAVNVEATVADFIKPKLDPALEGNRAGIVHRLDRGTSGVIITAKNKKALEYLQKQFSQRKARKTYIALVHGVMKPVEALIDAPITRNPKKPQRFMVSAHGKQASTYYKSLKNFKRRGQEYSLLELRPATGRTHQLRVHLAYIGHPIVGDHVYGKDDGGLMLHALLLELNLPGGTRKVFEATKPDRFKDFFDEL